MTGANIKATLFKGMMLVGADSLTSLHRLDPFLGLHLQGCSGPLCPQRRSQAALSLSLLLVSLHTEDEYCGFMDTAGCTYMWAIMNCALAKSSFPVGHILSTCPCPLLYLPAASACWVGAHKIHMNVNPSALTSRACLNGAVSTMALDVGAFRVLLPLLSLEDPIQGGENESINTFITYICQETLGSNKNLLNGGIKMQIFNI